MKKKVLAVLLSTAMVLSLAACGGSNGGDSSSDGGDAKTEGEDNAGGETGGKGGYSFQMIVKSFQSTYWQAAIQGVEQAKAELNVEVEANGPANESDIADQVQMINDAIEKKPDGIALAACDTSLLSIHWRKLLQQVSR